MALSHGRAGDEMQTETETTRQRQGGSSSIQIAGAMNDSRDDVWL